MQHQNSSSKANNDTPTSGSFRLNWGHKLALAYIGFVAFMVGLVVLAFQQKFDLVAEDYYDQEIAYQNRINQMDKAREKSYVVAFAQNGDQMAVTFPTVASAVKLHFFRPSDEKLDLKQEAARVDSVLTFPMNTLTAGKYLTKVEWQSDGETYYQENTFVVH
jgi:hypothetical protein